MIMDDFDRPCCTGCGSTAAIEELHARGAISCCPERDMRPARWWRDEARRIEAERDHWKRLAHDRAVAGNRCLERARVAEARLTHKGELP